MKKISILSIILFALSVVSAGLTFAGVVWDIPGYSTATILFTAAASTTTVYTPQWVPQYLVFETATVPSALQLELLGGGDQLVNLTGAMITALNNFLKPSLVSAAGQYVIPIADGLIRAKNINISITNATATPFVVYGVSRNLSGSRYLKSKINTVLANSGQIFTDFDALLMPAMASTDSLVLTDRAGKSDNYEPDSLEDLSSLDQAVVQAQVNNMDRRYAEANFTPAANRDVTTLQWLRRLV